MKRFILLLAALFALWSCCNNTDSPEGTIPIRWDSPASLSHSDLHIVPLATDSTSLIGLRSCFITHLPDRYIVADDDKIICFDKTGKIQSVIAARGRGPQEAYDMRHIAATDSTILVADLGRRRTLEFGFDGVFRRAWPTERPFHNFTWFADAFLLDNQTGMHHDDCVLPVCNAEGEIIRTPQIPIVGKGLFWESSFFCDRSGCYHIPSHQNRVYLINRDFEAEIAYTFDFGNHGVAPEVCEKYAAMENPFLPFDEYLRSNDKIFFLQFYQTAKWLHLSFARGRTDRFNWFMNRETGRQYLVPITADGTSPWNHPVIGAEDDRFIVKVEAADYRRWPDCAVEGLTEDSNPVLLLCSPQED